MEERRKSAPGSETGSIGAPERGPALDSDLPESARIGFQLHEIVHLSRAFERQVGNALDVNSTDLSAMEHLIQEGSLTPGELARRLDISTAATTLVVDRLVALGHAQRNPHVSDRRKVVVVPAPESIARAFHELHPVIGGVAAVTDELSDDDRLVIEAFLDRVVGVYQSALGLPG
ncbi:MarR family winged helix-turn-helix transcriptional regulator [Cryobacterium cryoconiti]|uniref:MarR family winged helix-turn-helix transcriptional regulator n=1 Tax=Cryobacterium cryoconiti TaxID=1259239 RepID=UPI001F540CF9|nr:MarR family transcriptional regulator [Cryobacterium cryoconiti]